MGVASFPFLLLRADLPFHFPNAGVCWYPLKNYTGSLSEGADVLCELLLRCVRFTRLLCGLQRWCIAPKVLFLAFL